MINTHLFAKLICVLCFFVGRQAMDLWNEWARASSKLDQPPDFPSHFIPLVKLYLRKSDRETKTAVALRDCGIAGVEHPR